MPDSIVFLVLATFALVAALRAVTVRRAFHAVLWLAGCFFAVAALTLQLDSPFMAAVQLLLFIGGMVLLTAIAMMFTKGALSGGQGLVTHSWSGAVIALSLFLVLAWMTVQLPLPEVPLSPASAATLSALGTTWVDPQGYLLPLVVVSVLLLIVLIGALYLGKEL
jgi:NADH:ubiquinone oxidoreductase subunit 6 (subunit J)